MHKTPNGDIAGLVAKLILRGLHGAVSGLFAWDEA